MKRFQPILFAAILLFASQAGAQNFLSNAGFETWESNLPVSWDTDTIAAQLSSVAYAGSSAMRLTHSSIFGMPFMGTLSQDTILVSGSSFTLKGWYQFHPDGGDRVMIAIFVDGHPAGGALGNLVGAGSTEFTEEKAVYTAFAVGVTMLPNTEGDTASIDFYTLPDTTSDTYHPGTYILLDELVLDNTLTDVKRSGEFSMPSAFSLSQNYPNPFNPTTLIEFAVPKKSQVSLRVYNLLGQEVKTLVDQEFQPGRYRATFDGSGLASGMYLYRIQAGSFSQTQKMLLVK